MNIKTKLAFGFLRMANDNRKARKIAKKHERDETGEKYSPEWRNTFVLKRAKRMAKRLNVKLSVKGYDNLPKGAFILTPNHSSSFDVALVVMALEQTDPALEKENIVANFLAKDDIKKNKKARGWADILESFYLSRSNPREALKTLDEWTDFIKENKRAGIIFPEGTRSKNGEINEFKSGAFRSSKKAYLPIIPCTINNSLSVTDYSRKNKLNVEVIFHTPIKPSSLITSDNKAIAKRIEKIVKSKWKKPEGQRSNKETEIA